MARSAFYHEVDDEGNRLTIVNGASGQELNRSRLVRQAIWRPGMTVDDIGALDPDVYVPINPGAYDPAARVADMDAMGVDQAVVFPTLFNEYLPLVENPQAAAALAQGYNDWIWDFAAADRRTRAPGRRSCRSTRSLLARRELDRIAEKGFTSVVIRPGVLRDVGHRRSTRCKGQVGARHGQRGAPGARRWPSGRLGTSSRASRSGRSGATSTSSGSSRACTRRSGSPVPTRSRAARSPSACRSASASRTRSRSRSRICRTPTCSSPPRSSTGCWRTSLRCDWRSCTRGTSWVPLALEKSETYLWLSPQFATAFVCLEPEEVWDRHPLVVSFDSWEESVGDHARPARRQGGVGLALPQPRRDRSGGGTRDARGERRRRGNDRPPPRRQRRRALPVAGAGRLSASFTRPAASPGARRLAAAALALSRHPDRRK